MTTTTDERPPCMKCGKRPKMPGKHRCEWCWLAAQDITVQLEKAAQRRQANVVAYAVVFEEQARRGFAMPVSPERPPKKTWPPDTQWCSDCLGFVPTSYARGSKCKAHASKAAHAKAVEKKYGIDPDVYEALLAWQDGRCYICGNKPRTKRLAVDHDHKTGRVRGLLCADNEYGCNFALGAIRDVERALRTASYLFLTPFDRMIAGQPPREATWTPASVGIQNYVPSTEERSDEEVPAPPPRPAGHGRWPGRRGAYRRGR
jgi:hypothetical protein